MKKFCNFLTVTFLLIFLLPIIVSAETLLTPDRATMGWDEVTTIDTGGPIPAGSIIVYRAYTKEPPGEPARADEGEFEATQCTFTFPQDRDYKIYGCVQTVRVDAQAWGGTPRVVQVLSASRIACSDEADRVTAETFAWQVYMVPTAAGGLHPD